MINNLSMRKFKCIISISLGTYVHIKFTKRKWQHLQLTQTMLFRIKWDLRAFHWNALNTSILFKDPSCKPLFSSFKIVSYIICNNQMNDTKKNLLPQTFFVQYFPIRHWLRSFSSPLVFSGAYQLVQLFSWFSYQLFVAFYEISKVISM